MKTMFKKAEELNGGSVFVDIGCMKIVLLTLLSSLVEKKDYVQFA